MARAAAGTAFSAWSELLAAVEASTPELTLAAARVAVAGVLTPADAGAGSPDPVGRFAEQMTADVAGVTADQRRQALAVLGDAALSFVQAVWVCDMSVRAGHALASLFGTPLLDPLPGARPVTDRTELWPAQERFMKAVAMLSALDPVVSEMVRLRGARAHRCRLCQSLRSRSAVVAAGDEALFDAIDAYETADLPERQKVALRVVDAFIWTPLSWPVDLVEQVRREFTPAEAVEIILDLVRNSSNKIAVAFAADAPRVEEGVEYYDIDATNGELVYGLSAG